MNKTECNLQDNEYWDCIYCRDRDSCPFVRNMTGGCLVASFILVLFSIFLIVIINI